MPAQSRTGVLIVFGRWPLAGRVKTRLADSIGAAAALAVYRRMLLDTLESGRLCRRAGARRFDVDGAGLGLDLLAGATGNEELQEAIRVGGWHLCEQFSQDESRHAPIEWEETDPVGANILGSRMRVSLAPSEQGIRCVLVGTDGAYPDATRLDAAFDALDTHDAVIGPAEDGGYLLLGAKCRLPEAVFVQRWSTPQVFASTCAAIEAEGLTLARLPTTLDVDTLADLRRVPELDAIARAACGLG